MEGWNPTGEGEDRSREFTNSRYKHVNGGGGHYNRDQQHSRQWRVNSRGGGMSRGGNWRDRNAGGQTRTDRNTYQSGPDEDTGMNTWNAIDMRPPKPAYRGRRQRGADDVNTSMEVPSAKVGRIIGRGGTKIRELQEDTDTEIKVQKNQCSDGDVTVVELIGSQEAVDKVRKLIEELTVDRVSYPPYGHNSPAPEQSVPDVERATTPPYEPFDWKEMSRKCEEQTKAFWAKLPPIHKDFYVEDPEVAAMTPEIVQRIRQENNDITVGFVFEEKQHTLPIPNPVVTFEQCFRQYPEILDGIKAMGFEHPSPIQCQAWPVLLRGQDLIGIAQTGTGKTLAFLLPALIHIEGQMTPRAERSGPTVLVLAPTRELAQQIEKEVNKYNYKDMKAVCIYGGGSRKNQISICTQGVEIVIATPGRLSDLTIAGHIDLKSVSYLVLDEADRMLDLGFEPQIRKILLDIRPNRQTVMTSATWPPGVRRLAQSYTQDPVQVCVGSLDLAAVHSVTQTITVLEDNDEVKYKELMEFIQTMTEDMKIIVFCGKKARVADLASELVLAGINCQTIHGDLEQSDREQALTDISDGSVQILIATDVASRGIDISDITHVINYDFPRNVEEYVHRVGRTGRAGRSGESISFVTRGDWSNAKELISILQEANQTIPNELHSMCTRYDAFQERRQREREATGGRGGGGSRGRSFRGGYSSGRGNRW